MASPVNVPETLLVAGAAVFVGVADADGDAEALAVAVAFGVAVFVAVAFADLVVEEDFVAGAAVFVVAAAVVA
jgi:hypothetical protein